MAGTAMLLFQSPPSGIESFHAPGYGSRMSAAKPLSLVSEQQYLAGEKLARHKHEYSAGRIYMMAGASNLHNSTVVSLTTALGSRLRGRRCQPFNSATKVRIRHRSETRFYYPDAIVVCDQNPPDDVFQDHPVVLAEVISRSTRRIDEGEKLEAYLTIPTLAKYLLIETASARVVAYERAADGSFSAHIYEGLDSVIPLDEIGIELPLSELYERIDFSAAGTEDEEEMQ
jgi:Uma2 family endonuclease